MLTIYMLVITTRNFECEIKEHEIILDALLGKTRVGIRIFLTFNDSECQCIMMWMKILIKTSITFKTNYMKIYFEAVRKSIMLDQVVLQSTKMVVLDQQ